ncbi:MAG: glycosyltransferase family 39 protein [Lachnospiraceae bacterium]|nr:glycosyltransferase family 39 protein [Lachnospiraceae bacterium]
MKNNSVIKPMIIILTAALFLAFCFDMKAESIRTSSFAFLVICTLIVLVIFRKDIPLTGVLAAMITGAFIKIAYVIYTPVWCRQHDVVDFGAGEGHAAYMEYILSHKALPDFDPRSIWAFFQPPLHHVISAVWMWMNIRLGISEGRMHKNVQILPLTYMCLMMLIVYLICRQLNMRKRGTLAAMLVVSFHPIFILMSGSINNDALSVMLTVLAIYVAILWYLYPTTLKAVALALAIGFAMMAKLSSALIAPPVAVLMIYKIMQDTGKLKDKQKVISYVLELIVFAVIVFPLGLWWTIRNKLLFDMPANYIPPVGEAVEKFGFVPTFADIRTASPFLYMKNNGFAYDEYNLILATVKSSLFGEGDFANMSPALSVIGWMLLGISVVIILIQMIAAVRICCNKEAGPDKGIKLFLACTVAVFTAGYIAFALSGKNLSAMNPRYCAAIFTVLPVFTGIYCDRLLVLEKKAAHYLIISASVIFAALSGIFYLCVGLL